MIDGKGEVVRLLVTMLLAGGHVLMGARRASARASAVPDAQATQIVADLVESLPVP
ncbi:MAG TPA: hypothetical protein VF070_13980 [Streptosporangiaceae bacterium]